ncbi:hypothetical protein K7711_06145 [Nocardia sp. CA2R105]|uniref:hypothetical protein n=1 Tax=Nocardia coffeae TaxID=2873381 RepID=UPI001CA74029|nr:hypothetical protein [Nocardia coffeae]MBY8856052.1 hypothetical protein [Nocardia coffeae]
MEVEEEVERLKKAFFIAAFCGGVEKGRIPIEGRSIEDILLDFYALVLLPIHLNAEAKLEFSIDHRNSILDNARIAVAQRENDMAAMLFGTLFEHHINLLLSDSFERREYSDKTISTLIRSLGISAKVTALWEIARLKPWPDELLRKLNLLMERRNRFVHYKWKPEARFNSDTVPERELIELEGVEDILLFLEEVENDHVWCGRKEELLTAFRELSSEDKKTAGEKGVREILYRELTA